MTGITSVVGLDGLVREHVYEHVFGNADREVGGVLVGRAGRLGGAPLVTASIPAISATEQRSSLTFTQDAWEYVHRVMESDYPDDQIVGWYHSHPGFGIFLSEHDLFIHRNFFSGPSQIALVVDPLEGSEGVFGWEGAEVTRWYERRTTRPGLGRQLPHGALPPDGTAAGVSSPAPPDNRQALALGCALLVGVLLGLGLWEGALRDDGTPATPAQTVPRAAQQSRENAQRSQQEAQRRQRDAQSTSQQDGSR